MFTYETNIYYYILIATEHRDIAVLLKDHFSVWYPLGPFVSGNGLAFHDLEEEPLMRCTMKQVRSVIKSNIRVKSFGYGGLSIEHLKYMDMYVSRVLFFFYTICFGHQYLPTDLMKTIAVPIMKNRIGVLCPQITSATVAAKVYMKLHDTCHKRHARTLFKACSQSFNTGSLWVNQVFAKISLDVLRVQYIVIICLGFCYVCLQCLSKNEESEMFAVTDWFLPLSARKTRLISEQSKRQQQQHLLC